MAGEVCHSPGVESIEEVDPRDGDAKLNRLSRRLFITKGTGSEGRVKRLLASADGVHKFHTIVGEGTGLGATAAHNRLSKLELGEVGHD